METAYTAFATQVIELCSGNVDTNRTIIALAYIEIELQHHPMRNLPEEKILPTRTKTKIKEGAKKIVAKSKETIVNALTTLKEKGERIVERVTENIATGIARVEEMAKPVVEKVKDVVKAGCEIVTSIPVVEKTVEKAKHVLAKIKSWF